jgi:hypothetical protein
LIRHSGSDIVVAQWFIGGFFVLSLWLAIGEPFTWLDLREAMLGFERHSPMAWLFALLSLAMFTIQAWRYSRHRPLVFTFDAGSGQITRNQKRIATFSEVAAVRVWRCDGAEVADRHIFLQLIDGSEVLLARCASKERATALARDLNRLLGVKNASAS